MKREIKITVNYALIDQVNNKENEINRGIFLDKDQYEQLRQHFVSNSTKLSTCTKNLLKYSSWVLPLTPTCVKPMLAPVFYYGKSK